MRIKKKNMALYMIIFCTTILGYLAYIYFNVYLNEFKNNSSMIFILSWMGILTSIYVFFSWYKLTGKFFSLYTIFMLFFFLFNYGQPLMWAFGIHQPNEIGQVGLYTLGKPMSSNLVYTQILTLISILMFHFGAAFYYRSEARRV